MLANPLLAASIAGFALIRSLPLTTCLACRATADEHRYPGDVLFGALAEKMGKDATGLRLRERLEWAFRLALNQERLD